MRQLLDQILAAPADDAPRRIYADWLAERADPRGELIQVQLELEAEPVIGADVGLGTASRRARLVARNAELLATHGALWAGQVAPGARRWRFSRGFLAEVEYSAKSLLEARPAPAWTLPLRLVLRECTDEQLSQAVALPLFAHVAALDLRFNDLSVAAIEALGRAELPALRRLEVQHITQPGVQELLRSPVVEQLSALSLENFGLDAPACDALAAAKLGRLRTLALDMNRIGDAGLARIAPLFERAPLEELSLNMNALTDASADLLIASPHLGALRSLAMAQNELSEEARGRLVSRFADKVRLGRSPVEAAQELAELQRIADDPVALLARMFNRR